MNTERLKQVEAIELRHGTGNSLDQQLCVMQAVDYVATGGFSDRPECACPILTTYAITLNDRLNTEHRQKLKPLIPLLVDTREGDPVRIRRKQLIMWRNVTALYPLILDTFKFDELAAKLRALKNTVEDMAIAKQLLSENKEAVKKASYAYANADADANANAYANANANANADADAYANAYANAYAYANANANANANAYAYAYANANANAYAYAFRAKLADIAIETLRMAIAVTDKKGLKVGDRVVMKLRGRVESISADVAAFVSDDGTVYHVKPTSLRRLVKKTKGNA